MLHEECESPGQQSGAGEPIAKNSSRRCLLAACSARPPCAKLPPFPLSIGEFSSRCARLLSCFSNLSSRVHERDRRGPQCTRRKAGERAKKARRSISFFFLRWSATREAEAAAAAAKGEAKVFHQFFLTCRVSTSAWTASSEPLAWAVSMSAAAYAEPTCSMPPAWVKLGRR